MLTSGPSSLFQSRTVCSPQESSETRLGPAGGDRAGSEHLSCRPAAHGRPPANGPSTGECSVTKLAAEVPWSRACRTPEPNESQPVPREREGHVIVVSVQHHQQSITNCPFATFIDRRDGVPSPRLLSRSIEKEVKGF